MRGILGAFFVALVANKCYKNAKSEVPYQMANFEFAGVEAKLALYPAPPPAREREVLMLPEGYSV